MVHLSLADAGTNKGIPRILLVFITNGIVLAAFFSFSMLTPRSILPLSIRIAVREFVKGFVGS
jgi:hypothetical protein